MMMASGRFFKESFIPVLAVLVLLLGAVFYAEEKALIINDETVFIAIPGTYNENSNSDTNIESADLMAQDVIDTDSGDIDERYADGIAYMNAMQWEKAESFYREVLLKEETSRAYTDLSKILAQLGQIEISLAMSGKSLSIMPIYHGAVFNHAIMLYKAGKEKESLKIYAEIIKKNPAHFGAHFNTANIYLNTGRLKDAVTYFTKASELAGGDKKARALFNLGLTYRRMGSKYYPNALTAFKRSQRIRPSDIETRLMIGITSPTTADGYSEAIEQLNMALKLKPDNAITYLYIGLVNSANNKTKAAKQAYKKAIHLSPSYYKAHYNLGLLYLEEKRWNLALNHFQSITSTNNNHPQAQFNIGRARYGLKDYSGAITAYEKAILAKAGNYPQAFYNQGLAYRRLNNYRQAISAYQQALAIKPAYPEAWYNLATAYMRSNQYPLAKQSLETAITYKSDYYQAWLNLGVLSSRMNDNESAIVAYETALKIKPDYTRAMLNLASNYSNNNADKAIDLYKKALVNDQLNHDAWVSLGTLYQGQNIMLEAEKAFKAALHLEQENIGTQIKLANVFISNKKYIESIELLRKSIELDAGNTEVRLLLAKALRLDNQMKLAFEEINKAIQLEPDNQTLLIEKKIIFSLF